MTTISLYQSDDDAEPRGRLRVIVHSMTGTSRAMPLDVDEVYNQFTEDFDCGMA